MKSKDSYIHIADIVGIKGFPDYIQERVQSSPMLIFAFLVWFMCAYLLEECLAGILMYWNQRNAVFSFLVFGLKEGICYQRDNCDWMK